MKYILFIHWKASQTTVIIEFSALIQLFCRPVHIFLNIPFPYGKGVDQSLTSQGPYGVVVPGHTCTPFYQQDNLVDNSTRPWSWVPPTPHSQPSIRRIFPCLDVRRACSNLGFPQGSYCRALSVLDTLQRTSSTCPKTILRSLKTLAGRPPLI